MTKENAHLYLQIVQALADGKTVQFLDTDNNWKDRVSHNFGNTPDRYRIKPEPVMIPLGPEDVPPGSVVRGAGETQDEGWCLITSCSLTGIRIWRHCDPDYQDEIRWDDLYDNGSQIKRLGEDWKPCYKPANE